MTDAPEIRQQLSGLNPHDTSYAIAFVEALLAGVQVTVLEGPIADGGETWLRVRTASGNEGWVRPSGEGEVYLA